MNTISKKNEVRGCFALRYETQREKMDFFRSFRKSLSTVCVLWLALIFTACDFQGPWSYYPEETVVYLGVYTFGYIVADESPYVCFSKVYQLKESAAEDFAFFDSSSVTVSGKFAQRNSDEVKDEILQMHSNDKPNCFEGPDMFVGIPGESYTMDAVFKWDSAGKKVITEYSATTTIPTKIHAKGVIPPTPKGNGKFEENNYHYLSFTFLEYPYDVLTYKIPMEYDQSVHGILMIMKYDYINGGENQNTTMTYMMSSFASEDSAGYWGFSMKKPEETTASMGFFRRQVVGNHNLLDTMEYPGMSMPIGKSTIYFYATDQSFVDYKSTVLEALEDSRVVPKSNVENGMGVFSGMLRDSLFMEVTTDTFVDYEYMRGFECFASGSNSKTFDTKWCRLNRTNLCLDSTEYDWYSLRRSDINCYSTVASWLISKEDGSWNYYIDSSVESGDFVGVANDDVFLIKDSLNEEALQFYCFEYNFVSNDVASCETLHGNCQESLERTTCKENLWLWCSDRDWNLEDYPQCGTALVSRYYLEEMDSPILERVVENWCDKHPKDKQCKR